MARIAGVNIPQNKLVKIGLTYIYGIGDKFSSQICSSLKIPKDKTLNDLFAEQEIKKLKITNIKNQTNRLEELFIRLTTKND